MGKHRRAFRFPPDVLWDTLFEEEEEISVVASPARVRRHQVCDGEHVWVFATQESFIDGYSYGVEFCALCGMLKEQ